MSKVLYTSTLPLDLTKCEDQDNLPVSEEIRLIALELNWMEETNQEGIFYLLEEGHYHNGEFRVDEQAILHSSQHAKEAISEWTYLYRNNGMVTQDEVDKFTDAFLSFLHH